MNLFQHLEHFLGPTIGGWNATGHSEWRFQVLEFAQVPCADTLAICTLGLSAFPLASPVSTRRIQHELMVLVRPSFGVRNIPAVLFELGNDSIDNNRPYLCGDVVGPRGRLFEDAEMEAIFVYSPVYFSDEFHACQLADGGTCVIAWLIPITAGEAAFVEENGWESFVDLLVRMNPDLLNMHRNGIVT